MKRFINSRSILVFIGALVSAIEAPQLLARDYYNEGVNFAKSTHRNINDINDAKQKAQEAGIYSEKGNLNQEQYAGGNTLLTQPALDHERYCESNPSGDGTDPGRMECDAVNFLAKEDPGAKAKDMFSGMDPSISYLEDQTQDLDLLATLFGISLDSTQTQCHEIPPSISAEETEKQTCDQGYELETKSCSYGREVVYDADAVYECDKRLNSYHEYYCNVKYECPNGGTLQSDGYCHSCSQGVYQNGQCVNEIQRKIDAQAYALFRNFDGGYPPNGVFVAPEDGTYAMWSGTGCLVPPSHYVNGQKVWYYDPGSFRQTCRASGRWTAGEVVRGYLKKGDIVEWNWDVHYQPPWDSEGNWVPGGWISTITVKVNGSLLGFYDAKYDYNHGNVLAIFKTGKDYCNAHFERLRGDNSCPASACPAGATDTGSSCIVTTASDSYQATKTDECADLERRAQ